MKAIIINKSDADKFPLANKEKDSFWMYLDNSVSGDLWLLMNAENDIKDANIDYTVGQIEIIENPTDAP
jgi:hypothetical protein